MKRMPTALALAFQQAAPSLVVTCDTCDGSGKSKSRVCPLCGGTKLDPKFLNLPCPKCSGQGSIVPTCECGGSGKVKVVPCQTCHTTGVFRGDTCPQCSGRGNIHLPVK